MNLKFSIITPSYNQGQYLEETIDSVLSQNYPNLEYIIIDGGSTDNSVEIIRKYEKHLKYWISEKDRGHWDALNKGFACATGDILAWINSDDKYFPWTLSSVSDIFSQNEDIKWLTGLASTIDEKSRLTGAVKVRKDARDYVMGDYMWIQQESTFWRKELWQNAGSQITSNYKLMVDGELWARFFKLEKLWHVDLTLGAYRIHGVNRALVHRREVLEEMDHIVNQLKQDLGQSITLNAHSKVIRRKILKALKVLKIQQSFLKPELYPIVKRSENHWVATYDI